MNNELTSLKGDYTIDPAHSTLEFVTRHAMITKVRGSFDEFSATAHVDGSQPSASHVEVEIQAASVNTRSADRDGHLKSPDFFDVEKFPTLKFVSREVKITGDDTVEITGDFTIKDVTKPLTIPFEFTGAATDPFGNQRIGFSGQVDVNRKDWGLTWNAALEAGGVLVSDKVKLEFEISAIKQA
ncbi:Polyisoprenoid-binding protein YceI [Propionibacterium cyclohexanicum]|mgnify:CR=1 FL=1|uniref:Polyisoprenoid-binding protein YceI n=1 Tax=Propionibacterium cyclohexanicum TaxID=64702 RepID=A0A1H9RPU9_9ACTN|nr:YceI family protein [Propionibacterium cyclohexanicum]SER74716.1 Polyisoprenoid-binding protein YceI [Propionibacterium cyclohexanicum]